ncbi:uncharacterized protein LOC111243375 isoform X1 [Varroa destructor]|uniref:RING-type domain-containing protein n=1 Tax=Varroa destructor TaxID=109461 RepID=A0A7M7J8H4_VARDE|nr:uncharacterized protein LOC111243375 isoform X1 [Varroa destructor]XP_022644562.1 uncharacterized protein LOC111243375 isoform X1 [Varroa destructor]
MPSLNSTLISSCCHRVQQEYVPLGGISPKMTRSQDSLAKAQKEYKDRSKVLKWNFVRRWRSQGKNKEERSTPGDRDLDKNIKLILDKADKLLNKLDEHEPELAGSQDEECVICVGAKATMQTFPCGHRVVCRKCFVKTIQMAVSQRMLPLRCVICRTKIIRLKQTTGGFATPASHTPHLANTRACLLRQPGAIDPEGFGRSPFLTPEDYEKPQPAKQYTRQECRFHRHWKNKVAAAPLSQDVTDMLIVSEAGKASRTSPLKEDRRKKLSLKADLPLLATPPRKKELKRSQPLSPTIIVDNSRIVHDHNNMSQSVLKECKDTSNKDKRLVRLEGVAKDRRKIHAVVEKELEMIPLVRLDKPPSPRKRRGSRSSMGSTGSTISSSSSNNSNSVSTPEICVTPPGEEEEEGEAHLIITTQPIKKLEYRTERYSLPSIPPPKLTLVDPQKGDRQLSILDNAIDEEDELLLALDDEGLTEKGNLVENTHHETVQKVEVTSPTEIRIAPPPDFRRRSHRVAPEARLQKQYPPTTRFEKFKNFHVRQPLPLFPIPEREEIQEGIELRGRSAETQVITQAFYKVDDKMAVSQSIPLISADNMVTVGGSFLNSAARTKMALLSSFKQLRSKSPLKAFGVRSGKTVVVPLLDVAGSAHNM